MTTHFDHHREEFQRFGNELANYQHQAKAKHTHHILSCYRPHGGKHIPHSVDKRAELGKCIEILLSVQLGNFADGSSNLLKWTGCVVVILTCCEWSSRYVTYIAFELLPLPAKILSQPPLFPSCLIPHEFSHILLEKRGEILATEILEKLHEE